MMDLSPNVYLSKTETEALGITHQSLYYHVKQGHIRTVGRMNKRRFHRGDVLNVIAKQFEQVGERTSGPRVRKDKGRSLEMLFNAHIRSRNGL